MNAFVHLRRRISGRAKAICGKRLDYPPRNRPLGHGGLFAGTERRRETLDAEPLIRNRFRTRPRLCDDRPPEKLVAEERHDDRRPTGAQPGGGRAGAAMMADGGAAWKQPVVGTFVDQKHMLRHVFSPETTPAR